jgi:hypothetical protein
MRPSIQVLPEGLLPFFNFAILAVLLLASDGRMDGPIQAVHFTITKVAFADLSYYPLIIN